MLAHLLNSEVLAVLWLLQTFLAVWRAARLCRPGWRSDCALLLFPFFDTRRRSSLIAYRSLRHLTVTHTHAHTRLSQKKPTPQLHRWRKGRGVGGLRHQMRFVSKRAPMAVWGVCLRSTHGAVDLWTPLFLHLLPVWIPVEGKQNIAMDYSVCLLLLLSTLSSVSVGQFPTAQMWVQLQNSLLDSESRWFTVSHGWQRGFFTELQMSKSISLFMSGGRRC